MPFSFCLKTRRGQAQGVVDVGNNTNEPFRARVYAEPFTYSRDGGFQTLEKGEQSDLTPYLQFSPRELNVPAGVDRRIRFIVRSQYHSLGVPAKFDINEYAIALNPGQTEPIPGQRNNTPAPVQLEGLPRIKAPDATIAAVEQRVNTSNSQGNPLNFQGELQAVGTIFDGSAYLRINQPEIQDSRSWRLAEAQYLQQNSFADYVVGSQPTFWRTQRASNYWGFTTIQRRGFTSPEQFYGGGFNPRERLQAN